MYKFFVGGKEYKRTTVVLHMYDKNKNEINNLNLFGFINNDNDDNLIKKYSNIYITVDDCINLSKHIIDNNLRNLCNDNFKIYKNSGKDPKYVKITTFNTCSHHVKQVAKVLNKNLMYIGLGDTLGGSEYGIYFGLKTGIIFSKYICNLISTVKYF